VFSSSPSFPSLFFLCFSPVFPSQRFLAWLLGWRRWWADDGVGSAGTVVMENSRGSSPIFISFLSCSFSVPFCIFFLIFFSLSVSPCSFSFPLYLVFSVPPSPSAFFSFLSRRYQLSVFSLLSCSPLLFSSICPSVSPAIIGQRPCAGNGQLDNVCRGMTAMTYAP